jgi:hypothetical protein
VKWLGAALFFLLAATGTGSAAPGPGGYAKRVLEQVTRPATIGQAWDTLHPAHQRIVSRHRFIHCVRSGLGDRPYHFAFEVRGWRGQSVSYAEIPQHYVTRVRLRETAWLGSFRTSSPRNLDVLRVAGQWRWLLDRATYRQYVKFRDQQRICPE